VWLDCPEEGRTWTYAETLRAAERVGRSFLAAGAEHGDRVVLVAQNSSAFVRTWVGTAVAGLVEVPINTAYEHDFLAHQVSTVGAALAVVDDVFAARFVDIAEAAKSIRKFWVIDTGSREQAMEALRNAGWEAAPFEELDEAATAREVVDGTIDLPTVRPQDLASVLFTSGTTGPSKGVAMPHAQMYFFADECVSLVRLTADDAWMSVTPLFHGNAQFMAAYPTLVAGARFVTRSRFSASRWIDQIRESRVTVTNFIGVMMDFIWKQDPRDDDADNPLRCVFAAPTAASILQPMKERFGIEAFVEVFGLTETSAPIISPYGEMIGRSRRTRCRRVVRGQAGRSRDRRGGSGRRDRRARRAAQGALHLLDGLLQHARQDRRGVAQPLVPHG
jgi:crotonobetaine/carnitine-CoA ligase